MIISKSICKMSVLFVLFDQSCRRNWFVCRRACDIGPNNGFNTENVPHRLTKNTIKYSRSHDEI